MLDLTPLNFFEFLEALNEKALLQLLDDYEQDFSKHAPIEGNEIFEEFKGSLTEQYVLLQLKQCTNLDIFYWSLDTGIAEIFAIVVSIVCFVKNRKKYEYD